MKLSDYATLIKSLPVRQQSFTTKRSTWSEAENEFPWLKKENNSIFKGQKNLIISRQDVFNSGGSMRELILKTIYWGYKAGMRGEHFINILPNIDKVENVLNEVKGENLSTKDFESFAKAFKKIEGVSTSTYSKLLYFLNVKVNGYPCLILDRRLCNVFEKKVFVELAPLARVRYHNVEKNYENYLSVVHNIDLAIEKSGENIEQFLFIFGNHLKVD